jgi:hypothetical protein
MAKIIHVGSDPFGGRSLSTPEWAPGLIARWEDAENGQTVYVSHAQRTTGWHTQGGPIEGFDLRTLNTDDTWDYWVRAGFDAPVGLYRATGRDTMVPVRLSPRSVVMRVRVTAEGIQRMDMDKDGRPFELTGSRVAGIGRDHSQWLMGAATVAGSMGGPYNDALVEHLSQGDYVVLYRLDDLVPVWLELARHN